MCEIAQGDGSLSFFIIFCIKTIYEQVIGFVASVFPENVRNRTANVRFRTFLTIFCDALKWLFYLFSDD
jgi:hypothetical protein